MDVRVSAITPTPVGDLDIGKQLQAALGLLPAGSLLGSVLGRVLMPGGAPVADRVGKLINVTVIVINDSQFGNVAEAVAPTAAPPTERPASASTKPRKPTAGTGTKKGARTAKKQSAASR